MKSGSLGPAPRASGREALLLLGVCEGLADGPTEEPSKCRLPRVAVEGVGGLLEFDASEQAVDVTRDRVRRHDQRGIKRMSVLARTDPFACPTRAAIVTSVNPRSFAMLAKLCLNTAA